MQKMNKIMSKLLLVTWLFLLSSIGFSEQLLPGFYPKTIPQKAVIQAVDLRKNTIKMDSVVYPLSRQVSVMLLSTQHGSLHHIKTDMVIGFLLEKKYGKLVISTIWELPKELTPPPH